MTQTNGGLSVVWTQLLYLLPTILLCLAAVVVCVMNWQKAPTAAMFCLIGFGLIGFNSIFGAIMTTILVRNDGAERAMREWWSLVTSARMLLSLAGYVFLLIAVFSGREPAVRSNVFETSPARPGSPQ